MRHNIAALPVVCLLALVLHAPASGLSKPPGYQAAAAATVKAFYTYHFRNKFDYTRRGLRQRQRWLDATLYKLLLAEWVRSDASSKQGEAPELNGDPFTNSQEYPTSFRIGSTNESPTTARVDVFFTWTEKGRVLREERVVVELTKAKTAWRISNIIARSDPYDDLLQFLKRGQK